MDVISPNHILYPMFAMFLLVAMVLLRMRSLRFGAVRGKVIDAEYYRAYQGQEEPEPLRVIARHFSNLFEVPVLFYVCAIMIYVTQQVSGWLVFCAWSYVALRYLHTYVHLTANNLIARFTVYFASGFVLALMWATLLVKLLRAG